MSIEVLDVGDVGPGAAGRGGGERAVGAAAGPGSEGFGVEEGAGGGGALRHERDRRDPAALPPRYGDVGDRLVETDASARSRPICDGRIPVQYTRSSRTQVTEPARISASTSAMWRRSTQRAWAAAGREADEVERVERGAAAVEHADEVRERMAAVVAGGGGERVAPLVRLGVERGQARRQRQRPPAGPF